MTLYRTYRPQHFRELIGQETITTILQQALIQNRLSHAYLFSGPRGTGKTSAARIVARASVCLQPAVTETTYEPCNECEACLSLLAGTTTDLTEIDAASNRSIEDIRELREQVQYHPVSLKRKIYIIDEVHMLTVEAFNALLKTLEEPPDYCLFILATTELHKIPLTIRSRCQALRLERGSRHSLERKLRHIATEEHIAITDAALALLAEYADGGYRDAETLLESVASSRQEVTEETVRAALGAATAGEVTALIEAACSGNGTSVRAILKEQANASTASIEQYILQLLRSVRSAALDGENKQVPGPVLTYTLSQLLEAYILHKHAPIPALSLEIACLNIAEYARNHSGRQSLPVLPPSSLPVQTPPQVSHTPVFEAAPPNSPVSVIIAPALAAPVIVEARVPVIELRQESYSDVRKAWKTMIDKVCMENVFLGNALKDTVFHTVEGSTVSIHVRYKFHADKMNEKKNAARIKDIMEELTGGSLDILYIVSNSLPKHRPKKELNASVDDVKAVFGS